MTVSLVHSDENVTVELITNEGTQVAANPTGAMAWRDVLDESQVAVRGLDWIRRPR